MVIVDAASKGKLKRNKGVRSDIIADSFERWCRGDEGTDDDAG